MEVSQTSAHTKHYICVVIALALNNSFWHIPVNVFRPATIKLLLPPPADTARDILGVGLSSHFCWAFLINNSVKRSGYKW